MVCIYILQSIFSTFIFILEQYANKYTLHLHVIMTYIDCGNEISQLSVGFVNISCKIIRLIRFCVVEVGIWLEK